MDRVIWNIKRLWIIAKVEGDCESFVGHIQIVKPILNNDRHFAGIPIRQPVGDFNVGMHCIKSDKEMVLAGQPVFFDADQHLLDQAAHRAMHQISVVNRTSHSIILRYPRPHLIRFEAGLKGQSEPCAEKPNNRANEQDQRQPPMAP